jgi:hypothetical protein
MNIEAKVLNKVVSNRIQQHVENIIYHDEVSFIPRMKEWFNICKSLHAQILTEVKTKVT